ncbi:MAG: sigma-70 family RNA polymerase sigma factor [Alistipes sp.]|nr:sigma-70 family RNA polymerase sigma factor [Alistipes sp.]
MEELYRENAKIVYYYIFRLCHNRDLAEEITQETFLRAIHSIGSYDFSCKVSVWLCSIAKHIYWQYLRKYGRELPVEDVEAETVCCDSVEKQVLDKWELMEVLEEIKKLPPNMREVVVLRASQQLSYREIGEILGKTENWARVTFYRAKAILAKGRIKNEN